MAATELINKCKLSQRIVTTAFDSEIGNLLDAAMLDMGVAGVEIPETLDALVETAAFTYVKCHFGDPDDYDRLKKAYDEQKAQLSMCTGYTDWGDTDG